MDVASLVDMLASFEKQVVLPALWAEGMQVHRNTKSFCWDDEVDGIRRLSLELFLGRKTLAGFIELSKKWHKASTGLSELEAALCQDDAAWDLPHAALVVPQPDGSTISVVPLVSVRQFIDEGLSGPDAAGVDGLDHCIASYARDCFDNPGEFCVSIRGNDPVVRLSSAQVVWRGKAFVVTEHRGHRNGVPSQAEREALQSFLRTLEPLPEKMGKPGLPFPSLYDPEVPGTVQAMLLGWKSLLPSRARDWGVSDLADHFRAGAEEDDDDDISWLFDGREPEDEQEV